MPDLSLVEFTTERRALDIRRMSGSVRRRADAAMAITLVAFCLATSPAIAQVSYAPYYGPYAGALYPGFYLRAMAGAAFGEDMTFKDVDPNDPNAVLGPGASLKGQSNTSAIFGGGVGYRFTPLFWADVMASGIPNWRFHSGNTSAGAFTPLQDMGAKIDSITVMVNGYVDVARAFGLYVGSLQPYVMAGLGYARNHMDALSGTVPPTVTPTGIVSGPASFTGSTQGNFAWGAGAGFGVPIAANIMLDIGYEYLDLGEVRTGNSGTLTIGGLPITAAAAPMKAGLRAHTVQASLRFAF